MNLRLFEPSVELTVILSPNTFDENIQLMSLEVKDEIVSLVFHSSYVWMINEMTLDINYYLSGKKTLYTYNRWTANMEECLCCIV